MTQQTITVTNALVTGTITYDDGEQPPASGGATGGTTIASFTDRNEGTIEMSDGMTYLVETPGKSWSLKQIDDDILRFEVRHGDHFSSSYHTDPATSERCEVAQTSGRFPNGVPIVIEYGFLIEEGDAITNTGGGHWLVLGQVHEDGVASSPPGAIEMKGERMCVNVETPPTYYVYEDGEPIERGRWYQMRIEGKWSTKDGYFRVYRDGESLCDYRGRLGSGAGVYWKQGVYRNSAPETVAVHYRGISVKRA